MVQKEYVTKNKGWIVVTTINKPTIAIESIAEMCRKGWSAIVVGDTKTPPDWAVDNIHYLSVERQKEVFNDFADTIPYRHYSRKNLGYLYAMSQGADIILETDDDNIPYPSFGQNISRFVTGRRVKSNGWVNVYKYFTNAHIWPRGLPLDEIHSIGIESGIIEKVNCPIQQFLADNDPDVDAIYRLIFREAVNFDAASKSVILEEGTWVPFNSQNTLFFREAFPLMYLPCHVSFRMTDIWRSFVAQVALWEHGHKVAFQTSTVKQVRNEHDFMDDFNQEIIGYTENRRIANILNNTRASLSDVDRSSLVYTAHALWKGLANSGIIPEKELGIIEGWFDLVEKFNQRGCK